MKKNRSSGLISKCKSLYRSSVGKQSSSEYVAISPNPSPIGMVVGGGGGFSGA